MSNLTQLAREIHIENLLVPPSTYLADRRVAENIAAFNGSGRRAFGTRNPFPTGTNGKTRFPRVLRETTSFVLMEKNITSEGLFRVPPHSRLRDSLKEAYDRGQKYIIWKDNDIMLPVPPYPRAEHQDEILAELPPTDAYSVYMAAALIKPGMLLYGNQSSPQNATGTCVGYTETAKRSLNFRSWLIFSLQLLNGLCCPDYPVKFFAGTYCP